jgi:hypothetical protein
LFQPLQPFGLTNAQPAVFLLPAIIGLLGDAELATRVDYGEPFAQLNLDGSQLLNDLFRRIPFPCHPPSFR